MRFFGNLLLNENIPKPIEKSDTMLCGSLFSRRVNRRARGKFQLVWYNILKSRELLVNWREEQNFQSANEENKLSKSNNCTLDCTLEEHFVLEFLKDNPHATQKEIATHIHKSERTVKTITSHL